MAGQARPIVQGPDDSGGLCPILLFPSKIIAYFNPVLVKVNSLNQVTGINRLEEGSHYLLSATRRLQGHG